MISSFDSEPLHRLVPLLPWWDFNVILEQIDAARDLTELARVCHVVHMRARLLYESDLLSRYGFINCMIRLLTGSWMKVQARMLLAAFQGRCLLAFFLLTGGPCASLCYQSVQPVDALQGLCLPVPEMRVRAYMQIRPRAREYAWVSATLAHLHTSVSTYLYYTCALAISSPACNETSEHARCG